MILTFLIFATVGYTVNAQNLGATDYLNKLPKELMLNKSLVQNYRMITDYYDYDLKANFIRKARVVGDFSCGLSGDSVKWENVYISQTNDLDVPFPKGQAQTSMDGFTYLQSEEVVSEKFFDKIPNIDFRLKNMVWDMFGFEIFAYAYWDSLKLNKEFCANTLNAEVQMGADGTFENKDIRLTWLGVTKLNNELCAIIKYSQMNGPLKLDVENIKMIGRSHYWGEIYVSLTDKQIEYASLTEDVVTDVILKGQPDNILGYTVRNILLTKVK